MDYSAAIKNLFDSFTWDYTKENCPEMYRIKENRYREVLENIQLFEDVIDQEEIPENMILYLLDYIATNEQLESFINECIAPYVQDQQVGNSISERFYRSIDIYNRQMASVSEEHTVVLLTPIYTASSLIQNGYLFVNDIYFNKKDLRDYTTEELGAYDIYRYLIKLVLNPFKEWILYHLEEVEEVPVLIVSSLGTLTAEFMLDNSNEFLQKIQDNIKSQLEQLSPALDEYEEEEELN